jgi:two-component system, LytTR family, sensor kinase
MKTSKRFFFQVLFWLGIWLILWFIETKGFVMLGENMVILLFQICLIAGIIYFAVPVLLLKKRVLIFWVFIVICVLLFSFFSVQLLGILGFHPPHPPQPIAGNRPPMGPSRFIINFLTLCITASISIGIEMFIFAEKKERENILNKNEMLQTELKLLKFQINPHFLFNTLNNIYTLSVIDSNKTQQSIAYLHPTLPEI